MLLPVWWFAMCMVSVRQYLSRCADVLPQEAVSNAQSALEYNTVGFRNAVEAGAKIAMGSDAGTPFNDHGHAWRELLFMVKNGMSPMQVLNGLTHHGGADFFTTRSADARSSCHHRLKVGRHSTCTRPSGRSLAVPWYSS